MAKQQDIPYENNPFYIGLNGLKTLFANAQSVAIFAIVLSVAYFLSNSASSVADMARTANTSQEELAKQEAATNAQITEFFAQDPGRLVVAGVIGASAVFLIVVVILWLYGALEYTAARLAQGEKVELKTALRETGKELASYIWLYIIITFKVFLWTLLLIIPGIIMSVRYSLAGTAFFAEGKRGNAAVKRSLELTKGAWFTTFAGTGLWNLITFGAITWLIQPGANAVLYSQLSQVTDAGQAKPPAHWLSWLTLIIPITLFVLFVGAMLLIVIAFAASFGA